MTVPYQLIIFDWEGTIADTLATVLHAVIAEANRLGLKEVDPYEARKHLKLGLDDALQALYPELSRKEEQQLALATQHALNFHPSEIHLIPGVLEFIHQVRQADIDVAIATNKGHRSLLKALQDTQLDTVFQITRSAGQVPSKPCPQMLEEIMTELHHDAPSTLMIGDSPSDMYMAQKIAVSAIGIDFYHQQEEALSIAGASAVFDNYQDLATYLHLGS